MKEHMCGWIMDTLLAWFHRINAISPDSVEILEVYSVLKAE